MQLESTDKPGRRWNPFAKALAFSAIFGVSFFVDTAIADYLAKPISSGQVKAFMRAMRCWGEAATLIFIALGVAFACRHRWKEPVVWVLVTLICATSVTLIKPVFFRVRPSQLAKDSPDTPEKWNSSFPSGHTATAFAFARCLSTSYPAVTPICVVAAIGTGGSRMFEQRHYFSDCIAGGLLGWYLASFILRWTLPLASRRLNWQPLFSRQDAKVAEANMATSQHASALSGLPANQ